MPSPRRGSAPGRSPPEQSSRAGRASRQRPGEFSPLDPVDRLPGLGSSARAALAEHGIRTVADLLWTLPSGWDDLRTPLSLAEAISRATSADHPQRFVFRAIVKSASVIPIRGRRAVRVVLTDASQGVDSQKRGRSGACSLHAFWFFLAHGVLAVAKPGAEVLAIGRITVEPNKPARTAHPDLFADTPEARIVRPRYPRLGPSGAAVCNAITYAMQSLAVGAAKKTVEPTTTDPRIDPVPGFVVARERMPDSAPLLSRVHATTGALPSDDDKRAFLERLAWAEAFTRAWERLLAEEGVGALPATPLPLAPKAVSALEEALGFAFTSDQRAACDEISRELARTRPMRRLLLGDVGTGKTAVALAAIAQCVAAGRQAAILAPTSVLAEQYLRALRGLEKAFGARIAFVAAGMPAAERRKAEAELVSGAADVAIGTHALLGEAVVIPRLSLVVVDEQQRLGVGQRLALVKKGARERPHLLTLSATPIPRTLALALRGELATSTLRERPAGRAPVATTLAPRSELADIVRRVAAAVDCGERVFWIVPRVAASDDDDDIDDLASTDARATALREAVGAHNVIVIHGKMAAADKRAVMSAFRSGVSPVLVGTTVVEVGVDVPEATLIVIEDAERFGLAQLHQLRGRVGRGERRGACILLHRDELEGIARERLVSMTKLATGEEVARADLELRGAGDLGGTRQHGIEEELVYLDPNAVYRWLERIEDDARTLRANDPDLTQAEHRVLGSIVDRMRRTLVLREESG